MRIILASGSPRRKMLLSQLGIDFVSVAADVDEIWDQDMEPALQCQRLAQAKADNIQVEDADSLIIAADTVVVLGDIVLGKPESPAHARRMLSLLSGRKHRVITGLCIRNTRTDKRESTSEITTVSFRTIREEEIDAYILTGEPLDKAGAYAVQGLGAIFVEKVEGCYYNVVGLPLHTLYQMLYRQGVFLLGA